MYSTTLLSEKTRGWARAIVGLALLFLASIGFATVFRAIFGA